MKKSKNHSEKKNHLFSLNLEDKFKLKILFIINKIMELLDFLLKKRMFDRWFFNKKWFFNVDWFIEIWIKVFSKKLQKTWKIIFLKKIFISCLIIIQNFLNFSFIKSVFYCIHSCHRIISFQIPLPYEIPLKTPQNFNFF